MVAYPVEIVIAESDEAAHRIARAAYEVYQANIQHLWHSWFVHDLRVGHEYDAMVRAGAMIAGAPATVQDIIGRQLERLPLDYFVLNMKWGNLSAAQSLRTLELFTTKVRPGLAERR